MNDATNHRDLTAGIPALDDCYPGFQPSEFNIVIAVEAAKSETVTRGGIIMPQQVAEREKLGSMFGRLVAVSPLAFTYENWPDDARRPQVGDPVIFAKYAGVLVDGADGREYRLCKDRDLAAVIEEF